MMDVNIEFSKGILFVRLRGILDKTNENDTLEKIFNIIKEGGIRYLVFNTEKLEINGDITLFDRCNKIINDNDGKMLICGLKNNIDNYECINDELSAFKLLTV